MLLPPQAVNTGTCDAPAEGGSKSFRDARAPSVVTQEWSSDDTPAVIETAVAEAEEAAGVPAVAGQDGAAPRDAQGIDAIDQEIRSLEELIRLQQAKVAALGALRKAYVSGQRPAPAALGAAEGEGALGAEEGGFEDYLVGLGAINVTEEVSTAKILTFQIVKEGESVAPWVFFT